MLHLRSGVRYCFFVSIVMIAACGSEEGANATLDAEVAADSELLLDQELTDDQSLSDMGLDDAQVPDAQPSIDMAPTGDAEIARDADMPAPSDMSLADQAMATDQAIDAMLLPQSLWSKMDERSDLSAFMSLVELAGYRAALQGVGRYTVFAPSNTHLQPLIEQHNLNESNLAGVRRLVEYHLSDSVLSATDIRNRATVPTLLSETLRVSIEDGTLILNETLAVSDDELEASNGFLHVIPGVLDPDARPILGNVVEVLRSEGQFSRFVALLDDLNLSDELSQPGAFTVFAPTNTAIENWERLRGDLSFLSTEQLRFLTERHLVDQVLELIDGISPLSFAGITLPITNVNSGAIVAGARVSEGPIASGNGNVFVLSDVIAREQDPTLFDWLKDDGRFEIFVAGLEGCGLNFLLDQDDWSSLLTVLAPTDDAFTQYDIMTDNARLDLFMDPILLGDFMRHHILQGEYFRDDLSQNSAAQSASGRLLPVTEDANTDLLIAGSRIAEADVMLHNGLVHVMDAVIVPPELELSGDCDEPVLLSVDTPTTGSNVYADGVFLIEDLPAGQYCLSTFGSGFDTVLSLRDVCSESGPSDVVQDDIVAGIVKSSQIPIELAQNEVKHVIVSGANEEDGDFILTLSSGPCTPPLSMYELLELMPNHVTFLIGLDITNIGPDRLAVPGATTAFVPDENAFDDLDRPSQGGQPGALDRLLQDPDSLTRVINHHLLDGKHSSAALAAVPTWTSLASQALNTEMQWEDLYISGTRAVSHDLEANNGFLHTVEDVIVPLRPCAGNLDCGAGLVCVDAFCVARPPPGNLLEELTESGLHTRFIQLLQSAELSVELAYADGRGWTVFAPDDAAFDLLDENHPQFLASLVEDGQALRHFLEYHIIQNYMDSQTLVGEDRVLTMNGLQLEIDAGIGGILLGEDSSQTPAVNDVGLVTQSDLPASNGVIHRVNRVLIGPTVAAPTNCDTPHVVGGFGSFIGTTVGADAQLYGTCSAQFCAAQDFRTPEYVFQFNAPVTGKICATTQGSAFDTLLYVRTSCLDNDDLNCGSTSGDEDGFCEVCNDDSAFAGAPQSALELDVEAGKTYYLVVDGCTPSYSGAQTSDGFFRMTVSEGVCSQSNSVVSILDEDARTFRTLLYWLRLSGLDSLLEREDEYTLLAPTESAFDEMEALFPGMQAQLVGDADALRSFLLYHIVPGKLSVAELNQLEVVDSLDDTFLEFQARGTADLVNGKVIRSPDLEADNGYVHVLDNVLMPPVDCAQGGGPICASVPQCIAEVDGCRCTLDQCMPVPPLDTLYRELASRRYPPTGSCLLDLECGDGGICQGGQCSQPMFSMFLKYVDDVGLRPSLENNGPYTIFAPTNYAFQRFEEFNNAAFLNTENNLEHKEAFVRFHRVASHLDSDFLRTLPSVRTDANYDIAIDEVDNRLTVEDIAIEAVDQNAYNGIFHVIDDVLLPPIERDGCLFPEDASIGTLTESISTGGAVYGTTCGSQAGYSERVYRFELAEESRRICITTHGSDFDTVLHIRENDCQQLASQASCDDGVGFTCCNDDAAELGNLMTSQLSLNAQVGVPYFIFVDSFEANASGNFQLNILDGGCEAVPVLENVVDVLDANVDRFGLMKSAIQRAQFTRTLEDNEQEFTVFAPVDDAFRAFLYSLEGQPTEPGDLTADELLIYLQYLVVAGNYSTTELLDGLELTTLDGAPIFTDNRGPNFFANGNAIMEGNLWAQNGVVHGMDIMLRPPSTCDAQQPCGASEVCADTGYCRPVPPPGTCANPIDINIGSVAADTSGAGNIDAVNYDEGSCGGRAGNEVVFRYTQTGASQDICLRTSGSDFNTILYVRDTECYNRASELACNDNSALASPLASALTLPAEFGGTYFVIVDGFSEQDQGNLILQVSPGACQ